MPQNAPLAMMAQTSSKHRARDSVHEATSFLPLWESYSSSSSTSKNVSPITPSWLQENQSSGISTDSPYFGSDTFDDGMDFSWAIHATPGTSPTCSPSLPPRQYPNGNGLVNMGSDLFQDVQRQSEVRKEKRRQQNRKAQQAYRNRQEKYVAELQGKLETAVEECKLHQKNNATLQRALLSVLAEREELAQEGRRPSQSLIEED